MATDERVRAAALDGRRADGGYLMRRPDMDATRRCCTLGIALLTFVAMVACAGAKISAPVQLPPLVDKVDSLALAPSGGVLADAIGTELFGTGFKVIDTQETSNFLVRMNLDEIEILTPRSLTALQARGINAVLSVKAVGGYDGKPQSATVRVVSTKSGELVGSVNWQNGRGGAQGSPADAMMRKDIVSAAQQIGKSLADQLRRR
jgi:hypothetical protein